MVGGEQAEQERDNTAEDHKHAAEGRALRRRQDGGAECLVQRLLLLAHLGARGTPELSASRGTWAPRRGVSYGRQRTSRWSALAERLPSRSACTRVVTTKHRKHR